MWHGQHCRCDEIVLMSESTQDLLHHAAIPGTQLAPAAWWLSRRNPRSSEECWSRHPTGACLANGAERRWNKGWLGGSTDGSSTCIRQYRVVNSFHRTSPECDHPDAFNRSLRGTALMRAGRWHASKYAASSPGQGLFGCSLCQAACRDGTGGRCRVVCQAIESRSFRWRAGL